MKITSIKRRKNNEKRFSIYIDGEYKFAMDETDVLFFKIKEGSELSFAQYEYILENVIFIKAKDTAFRYLGFKPRTYKEVYNKLLSKDYTDDIINRVMDVLEGYGYVNDYDYAFQYINERNMSKKEGPAKIKYDLKIRGISDDIIDKLLNEFTETSQLENAIYHLENKLKSKNPDFKEKNRLYNYLLRRGFTHDTISAAFQNILSDAY